ncbi:hypothetical protein ABPG77_010806 [Micractinium sp. CCAP 211/92]
MAALDCFLELDSMDLVAASPSCSPAPPTTASADAHAGSAAVWAWKQQQLKLAAPEAAQEAAVLPAEEDDTSDCTASPGCSYSGAAAEGAALLDLADDACSSPHVVLHASPATAAAAGPAAAGAQAAARTFFNDLAAGGSLYQYCLRK